MVWVYLFNDKSATSSTIKKWVALVETEKDGQLVKRIRSDGGGEYVNNELDGWFKAQGTFHKVSVPHSPQQNGVAERLNRTLVETIRSMLAHAHVDKSWWGEATMLATWIHNRSLTKTMPNVTPLEAWSGDKPNVSNLRTFGCICYYHVPDATRTKLEAKARVGMYLSHSLDHKGWRVWELESGKVVVSRDVSFFKSRFPTSPKEKHSVVVIPPTVEDTNEPSFHDVPEERSDQDGEGDVEKVGVENEKDGVPSTVVASTLASTRARRAPHPNQKYADYSLVVEDDEEGGDAMCFMADFTPTTYCEAMETLQASNWTQALNKEYESIIENDVYDLVPLPPNIYTVGSWWVFKKKLGLNGEVERYKARLVARLVAL
ncbi:unnamed protein product [Closterium sp. Yama58-4]|nr:unnamed protein product [Closterium sp. Yama58-4]